MGQARVSQDVYNKVGSILAEFGEAEYQVPAEECNRIAQMCTSELGREIVAEEVKHAVAKFKKTMNIPSVRGIFRTRIINGQLITREVSKRYHRGGNGNRNNEGSDKQNDNPTEETQMFIPPHLKPFENAIKKQVKLQTSNLQKELSEAKKRIKDLEDLAKDLSSSCHAEAERYKSLVVTYDNKMTEMRHMYKIIEAVDEYTAFKRSTCKRKTDAII